MVKETNMDLQMNPSQEMLKPKYNSQPIKVIVGSAKRFKGVPELSDYYHRPLKVNSWSQTEDQDFFIMNKITLADIQSQREKELENNIKVLEENLRLHLELLSQIHATSAKTSALLRQPQPYIKPNNEFINSNSNNTNISHDNFSNGSNYSSQFSGMLTQLNSKTVNDMNTTQQVSAPPAESVKYMIIAEGTGNSNEEPIEIQLAEEDGALNLNSSAESGRLEICLTPKENVQVKTEYNAVLTQNCMNSSVTTTHNEQQTPNLRHDKEQSSSSLNNMPQQESIDDDNFSSQSEASIDAESATISIGPNNTRISAKIYQTINWSSASIATRKLLRAIFDRHVLATHSMTGKPSPAFKDHDKPVKQMLDPFVIADVIYAVTHNCNVTEKEVRNAITTKCADENKMMKLQMNKRTPTRGMDKENLQ